MLKMLLRSSALALLMSAAFSPAKTMMSETGESKVRSSKRISSEEGKDYSLSKALNSQLEMDEKTNLPTGWNLVRNRESDKPFSIIKKRVGIEILGDDYTFYHDLSGLKNFDKTTFLFSVELRSTNPGVRIQYYDGKKDVTSPSYRSKKGEWETLNIEFTVDGNARFHRLYSAILGSVKNNDKPSVDILNIKLQQKQLSSAPVVEEKKTEQPLFGANLKSAASGEKPIEAMKTGESTTNTPVVPQLVVEVDKALPQSQPELSTSQQDDKSQAPELASHHELAKVKFEKEKEKPQQSQQGQEDKLREEQQLRQEKEGALNKCKEAWGQLEKLEKTALEAPFSEKDNRYVKTKEEKEKTIRYVMKEQYAFVMKEEKKINDAALGKDTKSAKETFITNQKSFYASAVNYFAWLNGEQAKEAEHLQIPHSEDNENVKTTQQMENQFLEWLQSSNPQKEHLLKALAEKFLKEQQSSQFLISQFKKDTGYNYTLLKETQKPYKRATKETGNVTIGKKSFEKTFVDSNGDKKGSLEKKVLNRILKSQGSSPFDVHIFSDSSQEVFRFILLGDEKYAAALLLEPVAMKGEFSEKKK